MSTISASTTSTTAFKVTADTTGVLTLQTGATPTTALTVGSDQSVTFAQAANLPNTFGFKNRIINGAMVIDARNAGASVTFNDETFPVDRFRGHCTQTSKLTAQRSSTAPAGFSNSLLLTSSSAYSVTSGDIFMLGQGIEGFNVGDLGWGTANAQTITLSFWVRSSLTGTFGGALRNSAGNRSYPFTYTISVANTFEYKTVTVVGDTSGTWLTDNGVGIRLVFSLGAGSTYSGTAGAWAGSNFWSATGATSVVGTNGATFYITGVQLEKGSTATSFDYRPYGTELVLCQRYFYSLGGSTAYEMIGTGACITTGSAIIVIPFEVQMRTTPSFTSSGNFLIKNATANTNVATTSFALDVSGNQTASINVSCGTVVAGDGTFLFASNSTASRIQWSAEL